MRLSAFLHSTILQLMRCRQLLWRGIISWNWFWSLMVVEESQCGFGQSLCYCGLRFPWLRPEGERSGKWRLWINDYFKLSSFFIIVNGRGLEVKEEQGKVTLYLQFYSLWHPMCSLVIIRWWMVSLWVEMVLLSPIFNMQMIYSFCYKERSLMLQLLLMSLIAFVELLGWDEYDEKRNGWHQHLGR